MIYLDNAATTYPKPRCVYRDLAFCLKKYGGNPGRSSHRLSLQASEAIYSVREKVAKMLGVSNPEHIVFTYNATYALNIAIKALVTERCHIITSGFEHNSVIRPLEALKERVGIEYSQIGYDEDTLTSLKSNLRTNTKGIVCSIASNVTGRTLPLPALSKFATDNSLFLIIDGSQAVGHTEIDLSKYPCDAFCAPGHKGLFGIQGCGFVYFRDPHRRYTLIEGGSGSDSASVLMPELLPEGYEAGTLSTPAIVSLGSGIDFINRVGLEKINNRLWELTDMAQDELSEIHGVKIYGQGCGILSFNLNNIPSSVVSAELDKRGICVRGGLHCAPSIHRHLGTIGEGAVRISFSYLNRENDVDLLYRKMKAIQKEL